MFKNILLTLGIIAAMVLTVGFVYRDQVMLAGMAAMIAPEYEFDPGLAPAAPDYGNPDAWAASPVKADPADDHPEGTERPQTPARVSVFFVHPTSYFGKENWNQPLENVQANWIVDERVLRHQASVFNGCCEVYAPRYRQATFYSFMDESGNGEAALDHAYRDVVSAFDAFLAALPAGAPFILAGHSQGSFHGARLLRERIADTRLQDRLVAAYLIGFSITLEDTGGVPACADARQSGCVIGWNATEANAVGLFPEVSGVICVNPLTWEENGGYADHQQNAGGIGYPNYSGLVDGEDVTKMAVESGAADAECRDGLLAVADLRSMAFPARMPGGSMHVYDYSLFYMNIRDNAIERSEAFLARR